MSIGAFATLACMLIRGAWMENRGRVALTIVAIALGVALGTAVHIVNHSAASELTAAVRGISGNADVTVRGSRSGFSEDVYPHLARDDGVTIASPMLELDAKLTDRPGVLRILGVDPFRALSLQPALFGEASEHIVTLLQPGTALLTIAAAKHLGLAAGETLNVQVGTRTVGLRILGLLPMSETLTQPLALMDIASAQWALDQLGSLNRIDLRLAAGTDRAAFIARLNATLPAGVAAAPVEVSAQQGLALSRAYRVNLNMLALVSMFTGAVLVFSTQTLTLLRRRTHFALLHALGLTQRGLAALLVTEAASIGLAGTLLGLVLGIIAGHLGLTHTAGDLGAGFFSSVVARTHIDPLALAVIAAIGIGAATLSGWLPAIDIARARTAAALRAGDEQDVLARTPALLSGTTCILLGAILVGLPPIDGLPLPGYAAIACFLIAALLLVPACVRVLLAVVPLPQAAPPRLALAQLRGASGYAGISLAAIVASFSVSVAMLIMIYSFRMSLVDWLHTVLPADLYARAGSGSSAYIEPQLQERLRATRGVRRIAFSRHESLSLDVQRPLVTLIAREFDSARPDALPLVAPAQLPQDGSSPAWISEAIRDLYRVDVGAQLSVPIAGRAAAFTIAGVWRDYVRPGGSIVVQREQYLRLGGDARANEAWIWLDADVRADAVAQALRSTVGSDSAIEIREPGALRQRSLAIFDRTFAVTYGLQIVAILIGLFGISVGANAQVIARHREFGMLQHLGMTRRQIGSTLAWEGTILGTLGALIGIGVGTLISAVLIHVINRQSFHWSMETHFPWPSILSWSIALALSAGLTSAMSARRALDGDAVRAVRDDW